MVRNEEGVKTGEVAIGDTSQVVVEAPEAVPEIQALEAPDGYGHVVVVRDGYDVHRLDGRDEGKRIHEFDDLATFAEYLNRHGESEQVELLLDDDHVDAALDPKSTQPEIVSCELDPHPTFAAWSEKLGNPMPQKMFHQLVRGFRGSVAESEGLLAALRVVSVARKGEMTSEIDETGATRLNLVTEKTEMAGKLPPEFVVTTPVYRGIVDDKGKEIVYSIEILLSIDIDVLAFTLDAPALELVKLAARQDVAAMLKRELDDGYLVGLGKLAIGERHVFEPASEGE